MPRTITLRPILNLSVDAMDVSKFKVPRLLQGSKEFQHCWRPELHLQCVLIEGIVEAYYLSDLDVSKDSNLQLTIILRTLQLAKDFFDKQGRAMPDKIRLHTDNAVAEGKNQIHMKVSVRLVGA